MPSISNLKWSDDLFQDYEVTHLQPQIKSQIKPHTTPQVKPHTQPSTFHYVKLDVLSLGQVFTPHNIVSYMISLMKNEGSVLEPSCGNGAFLEQLDSPEITAIEKQKNLCPYEHINQDFFSFEPSHKFHTIIGNPPYVRHQDILADTKKRLDYTNFDQRTNLYMFFIDRSIDLLAEDGELIFITPRDFLKQTSAKALNHKLFEQGAFSHFKDFGDISLFKGFSPNCAVWRWQKGLKERLLDDGRQMDCVDGQIIFKARDAESKRLSDYFDVKVGAVSGADDIFEQDIDDAVPFVCSSTKKTGELRNMLYNRYSKVLLPFKERLISRKIKHFDETNWWQWGRAYNHREGERIYVNCKTRDLKPFFISDTPSYDGSVLALFPKDNKLNLPEMCSMLNDIDWNSLGFQCGGRYIFSQRTLQNSII